MVKRKQKVTNMQPSVKKILNRLQEMRSKYWSDLDFLLIEFSSLEKNLREEHRPLKNLGETSKSTCEKTLSRMQYFLANVRGTMERISKTYIPEPTSIYEPHQLDRLEKHIIENILPVKQRLVAQMVATGVPFVTSVDLNSKNKCNGSIKKYHETAVMQNTGFNIPEKDTVISNDDIDMVQALIANCSDDSEEKVDLNIVFENCKRTQEIAHSSLKPMHGIPLEPIPLSQKMFANPKKSFQRSLSEGKKGYRAPSDRNSIRETKKQKTAYAHSLNALCKDREVLYECSMCKQNYAYIVNFNSWWGLIRHDCPLCHHLQVPRLDIDLPRNADQPMHGFNDFDEDSDISMCTEVNQKFAENNLEGIELTSTQAAKLLILMNHARGCNAAHSNAKYSEVCRSTKYLMLHIRDCNGYISQSSGNSIFSREECKHPWCKPCRNLLLHLIDCSAPGICSICNPLDLPIPLKKLKELNELRGRLPTEVLDGSEDL